MQDKGLRLATYDRSMITRSVDIRVLGGMIDVSRGAARGYVNFVGSEIEIEQELPAQNRRITIASVMIRCRGRS